jgi:hypothetical protein
MMTILSAMKRYKTIKKDNKSRETLPTFRFHILDKCHRSAIFLLHILILNTVQIN